MRNFWAIIAFVIYVIEKEFNFGWFSIVISVLPFYMLSGYAYEKNKKELQKKRNDLARRKQDIIIMYTNYLSRILVNYNQPPTENIILFLSPFLSDNKVYVNNPDRSIFRHPFYFINPFAYLSIPATINLE